MILSSEILSRIGVLTSMAWIDKALGPNFGKLI